jgi:enoyl-CoA hydratase/carnithine racemase
MRGFEDDAEVRVIVVAGAGEKAFAAGSDISGFESVRADPQKNRHYNDVNERSYNAVYECTKPTVAMIRGYCIGGWPRFRDELRSCAFARQRGLRRAGRASWASVTGHEGILRFGRVIGYMRARDCFVGPAVGREEASADWGSCIACLSAGNLLVDLGK